MYRHLISRPQYLHLFANSATIYLFCALVKIHKLGNPIRPIVLFIGSSSYNIAQFLSKFSTPSTNSSPHKLKNAHDAEDKLKDFVIPVDFKLLFHGVKSLFTSIPQHFAIEYVKNFLEIKTDIYDRTKLNATKILDLYKIYLDATPFSFNGKYFK